MSSSSPHTPPAGASGTSTEKPIPHFQLPERTPRTPRKKHLPRTPSSKRNVQLKTPSTVKSSKTSFGATPAAAGGASELLPPTPDFTPQKLQSRRKRLNMDALFDLSAHMEHIGMLLPNHSTVGSGRKVVSPNKLLKAPLGLDFSEMSKINENLTFEEDYDESIMSSPSKRPRPKKLPRSAATVTTPGPQVITDDQVKQWHGKSFNTTFSSDEEDFQAPLVPVANPFMDSTPKKTKSRFSALTVDYSTHNEFVNHRTGEKRVEPLLESQKRFRPKKIDFSGV